MWTCSTCGNVYQRNTHLRRHESTHKNPNKFKCVYCGNEYARRDVCNKHSITCAKRHNGKIPLASETIRIHKNDSRSSDQSSPEEILSPSSSDASSTEPPLILKYPLADMPFLREIFHPTKRNIVQYLNENENDGALNGVVPKIGQANEPREQEKEMLPEPDFGDILGFLPFDHASILEHAINTFLPEDDDDFDLLTLSDSSRTPIFTESGFQLLEEISKSLADELGDLHMDLIVGDPSYTNTFDLNEVQTVFSADNIRTFSSTYFRLSHPHVPLVHYPTFGTSDTSKTLLMAVAMNGACRSTAIGNALTARGYARLVEEYIFRDLKQLMASSPSSVNPTRPALQTLQAAAITMYLMLFNSGITVRRRGKLDKLPKLVTAVRHFGLPSMRQSPSLYWDTFIYQEACIRVATWTAVADWYYCLTFYAMPTISIQEMLCRFPCPRPLWDATDSTIYIIQKESLRSIDVPSILKMASSPKDFTAALMGENWGDLEGLSVDILNIDSLYTGSMAISAMVIAASHMGTVSDAAPQLLRAIERWRKLWRQVMTTVNTSTLMKAGLARHSPEVCILAQSLMEARRDGVKHLFFDIAGHYSLQPLHSLMMQLST